MLWQSLTGARHHQVFQDELIFPRREWVMAIDAEHLLAL
jgi:hypothetical protein